MKCINRQKALGGGVKKCRKRCSPRPYGHPKNTQTATVKTQTATQPNAIFMSRRIRMSSVSLDRKVEDDKEREGGESDRPKVWAGWGRGDCRVEGRLCFAANKNVFKLKPSNNYSLHCDIEGAPPANDNP